MFFEEIVHDIMLPLAIYIRIQAAKSLYNFNFRVKEVSFLRQSFVISFYAIMR